MLETLDESIDCLANCEVQNLAIERGVVTRRAAEAQHLPIAQGVFAGSLHGIHDFGRVHVHDVDGDFGIRDLFLATAENAEQLPIAHLFPSELHHVASQREVSAFESLRLAFDLRFSSELLKVVAIDDTESSSLVQMTDEDGLGLSAETIDAVGEEPAHVT